MLHALATRRPFLTTPHNSLVTSLRHKINISLSNKNFFNKPKTTYSMISSTFYCTIFSNLFLSYTKNANFCRNHVTKNSKNRKISCRKDVTPSYKKAILWILQQILIC